MTSYIIFVDDQFEIVCFLKNLVKMEAANFLSGRVEGDLVDVYNEQLGTSRQRTSFTDRPRGQEVHHQPSIII